MADQAIRIYNLIEAAPEAIVVHCSDPRFQQAFVEFIQNELELRSGSYIPLVISGGVGSLAEPLKLPKEFRFMKERLRMFLERFESIHRLILINHEDCRHYEWLQNYIGGLFLQRFHNLAERQKADLKKAAQLVLGLTSLKLDLELYYARFADARKSKVIFEKVALE